ncbi:MAG: LacI family transcriptional regulator [Tabrizicola sp.]|uniref:LacI family transcriptional regulator n=1 Tax=Tabrizicola sp. TaxID=2005166 RepID=UPI0027347042|nr:LacI family transcriptional regulator [Tabrizicola sp.]MDP3263894.1 LacI family transcriptional regulator [Tabrizicola sp.]MDP3647258.1 LacI family transcriptional regulator [Paracoccaceae bacterium]MDZ4066686.1 LacI family transcriptional regulator [Tabrizicola sp.]
MALITDPHPPVAADSEAERPTLKTIAAATGLAVATVSRALKDAPDIGEETKRRVRETANLLGYRPNRAGVRLRTGKTNVIALVLSTETDVMNHTSRLIYSIANALRGTPYHLVVMPFFPDQDPMEPVRYIVETGSADGVILNQTKPDDPRVRYMRDRNVPFATHGRTDMGIDHPYFDFDNEAFARLAVRTFAERGRKRLLLIAPPRSHLYARHMTWGFSDEAALLGLPFELADKVTSDSGGEAVDEAVAARFSQPNPPDAILVGSTTAAMSSIAGAERAGRVLGRDFDVVAKEAIPLLRRFRRDTIIIREDVGRAGEFLARALVAEIEKRPPQARQGLEQPTSVEWGDEPRTGGTT